jgi:3,4-dihydroxy 2-butanone 4-phosphate synthase / GTP cyclohydrolase II
VHPLRSNLSPRSVRADARAEQGRAVWERVGSSLASGRPILVAGPDGCDLVVLAAEASARSTAFLIRHGTGFITVAMSAERLAALSVPPMPFVDGEGRRCLPLHVAVDARTGVTTGISAHDRARTIRLLADPLAVAADFTRPGHVVPVRIDLDTNLPPGRAESAAMVGLVAAGAATTAMCGLVSESAPEGIAQASEGAHFARIHGLALVHTWQVTQAFYRRLLLHQVDAL